MPRLWRADQTEGRHVLRRILSAQLEMIGRPHLQSWWAVIQKTAVEVREDGCFGLAAQLGFYFLLALFPALLFLVALIGYVPIENAIDELLATLGTVAPRELVALLRSQLEQIASGSQASLLTLGIGGAIWSSSAAMVAIIDALNHAYDVTEWRPWWKRRLVALGLTVALASFIIVSLALVLIGPDAARRVAGWVGAAPAAVILWSLLRWPVMIALIVFGLNLVYYFAPNRRSRWEWITPGAMLATGLWIASSFAFKFYVVNFGNYTATYGALGGIIVTMMWFYVSSLAILIGAELNGVIQSETHSAIAGPRNSSSRPIAKITPGRESGAADSTLERPRLVRKAGGRRDVELPE
jgi:membrane protein